ncbi:Bifunctional hemolysin/adenylate cyclase precursor [Anatilimnocola aggregata]|uniref:Bifunctional hemolysin/adenylate cyclase n=1 Tax=Anatilimnocola aggregata TaxID=2528021 RepID=A0A517YFA2_9BACT|nr:tandem-95 repeat protein [Anatilimnocola aggregata]QDU28822.1 Bifunctional hemolysin/adenylate cyclase precursor [Anatilimnocola aggregata]
MLDRTKWLWNRFFSRKQSISKSASPSRRRRAFLEPLEDRRVLAANFAEFIDPKPSPGNQFGQSVVTLITGNVVITSPRDDAGGTDAGAVYLFNGSTGALISTLLGSHANDQVGSQGVAELANGNFVVHSPNWDNGAIVNAGAVTWGNGVTGISGNVSSTNSLVGSTASDQVGNVSIRALTNGNYVVQSPFWNNGAANDAGAVTWGNGLTGIVGAITSANSLVGSQGGDRVSSATVLTNGNYVVSSPSWDNGATADVGAVIWGNGLTGTVGTVSAANSLVGTQASDRVSSNGVTALANGNYVVASDEWNNGATADAGAVTWGNGSTGIVGAVSSANSLVGTHASDQIGSDFIVELTNGNYVVRSPNWDNGAIADAGAVTWGNGLTGTVGAVTTANSLVGSKASDQVGSSSVMALTNGNYVVASFNWDNGTTVDAGAVTWGNGLTGIVGAVTAANSLVGTKANDFVGVGGITALVNGNYVVSSSSWDNGTTVDAGAVTWGNGNTGIVGAVTAANSLVGTKANDQIGSSVNAVTALTNGNYVVRSPNWDNGATADAGAVTWGNGNTGTVGAVTTANSLVGTQANDRVGSISVTALSNGNYVVSSSSWKNGAISNAGAVTWGNGSMGTVGAVTTANSLVGSQTSDSVGHDGVTALASGSYVVRSTFWNNGATADAGAVTWGNGLEGIVGAVTSANSLVGSQTSDQVGSGGITALANGNYIVRTQNWDNGTVANAGAVTWGNGVLGVSGVISVANSAIGDATSTSLTIPATDDVNDTFFGRFAVAGGDRIRVGSQSSGFSPAATFTEFIDPNPAPGNGFGTSVVTLATGNVVITSPNDDAGGANAGAVYLFNGSTGALISTLLGSHTNDQIGNGGITALATGNFVVRSQFWDNGAITNAGAVTWGSGVTGISGTVSSANSLVGSQTSDQIGNGGVVALTNGNYVVSSYAWDNGAIADVGAATWGSGVTGISGVVSAANSLVGTQASDIVGDTGSNNTIIALTNGNYVVSSQFWDNGANSNAGAVTWGNGLTGISGAVTSANSLVGSQTQDEVGINGVTALTNGNYVVNSQNWNNGAIVDAGAVTWGDGFKGITGIVTSANSLVGTTANDRLGGGSTDVTALANGNYVVSSDSWDNGGIVDAGAVTWGNGFTGIVGAVTSANSLVGTHTSDRVGIDDVTALTNGNYVVSSHLWDNGAIADAGAVTWGNGLRGVVGAVTSANSLVGSQAGDQVGSQSVYVLTNSNYVVRSLSWNNGAIADAGAVTWGNGFRGISGTVSTANSLVGSHSSDNVGSFGVAVLANGNYVVSSHTWDNGSTVDAGAATWGNGLSGIVGNVTSANSLVGTQANDQVGQGATALANGNYVVRSLSWNNGATVDAGAATWGNGLTGIVGAVTSANSLVGTTASDFVGSNGITALTNGNYVVLSQNWDNGAITNAGAATWGSGVTGIAGVVTSANSLVGSQTGDVVGSSGATALTNGNYVVRSPGWDNVAINNAGAVTWGSGVTGVTGIVTSANSAIGTSAFTNLSGIVVDNVNTSFFGRFLTEGGGRVRVGSQVTGFAPPYSALVSIVNDGDAAEAATPTNGKFKVELTAASTTDTIVSYTVQVASTATDGTGTGDYETLTGSVKIFAGDLSADIDVLVHDDSLVELAESVIVKITGTDNANITVDTGADEATVTITNDDSAVVSLGSPTITEGGQLAFSVTINNPVDVAVTANRSTADGLTNPATTADSDYSPLTSTSVQLFAAGSTAAFTINVDTGPDSKVELDEQVRLILDTLSVGGRLVTFDGAGATLTGVGTITNDDSAFTFTSPAAVNAAENQTAVTTVVASDADLPEQTVTYTITGGADAGKFSLTSGGVLTFQAAPNFELPTDAGANNVYEVEVTANDGNGGLTIQTISVTVTDVNDVPVFTSLATASVPENQTAVITVAASDADLPAQTVTYTITGGADAGKFSLTMGGVLTFQTAPNFELPTDSGANNVYEVEVTANDGNGGLTIQSISVSVTDVNDVPVFTSLATASAAENQTAVTTVVASDADLPAQTVTYTITGGADAAKFSLTTGGVLTFQTAPNFELPTDVGTNNVYEVEVTANDGNGGLTIQTISVTVTDVNDAPLFTSSATVSVPENQTAVTTVVASDADLPAQTVTYTITGGADAGKFSLTSGGVLTFQAAPNFELPTDAGANNVYEVQVTANDGNGGLTIQTISVTVTDVNDVPVFTSLATASVPENQTAVITVAASDADLPAQTVTYTITGGADAAKFSLTTGGVLTFQTAPNFELPTDAGTNNVYEVEVTANDGNGGLTIQTISVSVTDVNDAPVFTSLATASAAENQTAVITVAASDADLPAQTVTYTITGGADAAKFSLTTGGVLTFQTAPNFELPTDAGTNNVYEVEVTANDGNGGLTIQTISVSVTDVNDAPVFTSLATASAAENQTAVTTVVASDADLPAQTVTYTITGGADAGKFSLTTGGVLTFQTAPNFELPTDAGTNNVYEVEVTANDGNGGLTIQTISVSVTDVNDAPVFTSLATASAAENQTAVTTVVASDADLPAQTVTYTITGGADAGKFSLTTGGVLTFQTAPNFELPTDAGTNNVYEVEVTANDGNGGLTIQTISVSVTDVNDAPVFTSLATASAAENQTAVTTVVASDADLPAQTVTYTITGGADAGKFSLTSGGVLTFQAAPNFELPTDAGANNVYEVQVTANDGNGGLTIQTISVTVTDVNDVPVFTSLATASVPENQTAVITVAASDADLPAQTVTYTITGGADAAKFSLTTGGVLTFQTAPNFELPTDVGTNNVYEVEVTANDGNGGLTIQTISVTVTDVNDAPLFTSSATVSVPENQTAVTTVVASDADLPAQTVTYTITGGADAGKFSLTSGGVLTFQAAPNFELPTDAGANNVYEVQVTANDGNGGLTIQTISVTVTDVNDVPVFTSLATASVPENQTAVITVAASDADLPAQTVTYTITGGADAAKFSLTTGGVLTFQTAPNFELPTDAGTNNVYEVEVTANDGNGGLTIQTISVSVTDVNDVPVFTSLATASVPENQTAVITVAASDADLPAQTVTYTITGGADAGKFSLTMGGVLTFQTAPNFELPTDSGANNVYEVEVTANDGNGGLTIQSISVSVTDVNDVPVFTSLATASAAENQQAVTTVAASDADLPAQTVTYTITGGADAGKFSLTTGGVLTFQAAPNFELPTDAGANNVYEVQVTANDGNGGLTIQTISVTVTDVNDAPVFTSLATASVPENQTAVTTVVASDADLPAQTVTYTITGGADSGKFSLTTGGVLTFQTAPNFELPTDAGANNVYEVQVTANDGNGGLTIQSISVTVTDVNDSPVANPNTASTTENAPVTTDVIANDTDPDTTDVLSLAPGFSIASATFDTNNSPITISTATVTQSGNSIVFDPGTDFDFLPAGQTATVLINYTVQDDNDPALTSSSTLTITVNGENDAPIGNVDSYTTAEETQLTIAARGVLENDTDVDFGTTLNAHSFTQPTHGGVALNANGSFTYTPFANYYGPDSFRYRVTDGISPTSLITVTLDVTATEDYDFGDAPASYGVASHFEGAGFTGGPDNSGPLLGTRDFEAANQASPNANGDDLNSTDDEDGVSFSATTLVPRFNTTITVNASTAGKLDAWIDFNSNDQFDPAEKIASGLAVAAGSNTLVVQVPDSAVAGITYARFRISTDGSELPTGPATDGEVEDHQLTIQALPVGSAQVIDDPENPGPLNPDVLVINGNENVSDAIVVRAKNGIATVYIAPTVSIGSFPLSSFGRIVIFGRSGNDSIVIESTTTNPITKPSTIYGDAGRDTISGGGGPDIIIGGDGNDVMAGNAGDDTFVGGDGYDTMSGDAGNDTFVSGLGNDKIVGGAGIDTIVEMTGSAIVSATSIRVGLSADSYSQIERIELKGTTGPESFVFSGVTASVTIDGQGGGDTVSYTGDGNFVLTDALLTRTSGTTTATVNMNGIVSATLTGGSSTNKFTVTDWTKPLNVIGAGGTDTIESTGSTGFVLSPTLLQRPSKPNVTISTIENAVLTSVTGAVDSTFTIDNWAGTADLKADGGVDTLKVTDNASSMTLSSTTLTRTGRGTIKHSGFEAAELKGGTSANTINASTFSGNLIIDGDAGNDTLTGGSGPTTLIGGIGNDKLTSGNGTSTLYGGDGNDTLTSGNGAALLFGQAGNDTLTSGKGIAVLVGGTGNDTLKVGAAPVAGTIGHAILIGGAGNDKLTGGSGADVLIGSATSIDSNDAALIALLNVWNTDVPYSTRVANVTAQLGAPVTGDSKIDTMLGGTSTDLFFAELGETLSDRIASTETRVNEA